MTDRLTGISVFVEAVEADGFSAAAARLNLSRSAVGKTVARLEDRLGVRLFHRTTRSQSLTEDGQAYYEHCLRALEELRAAEVMLDSGRREVAGRLRVSMPVLFGRRCIAPILTALTKEHPKLELDLNFNDRRVDFIEDGFDLAVRNDPLGNDASLTIRRLAHQHMTICAAPGYLSAHGTPQTIEELRDHDGILYSRPGRVRSWLFPRDGEAPIEIMPRSRLRFDDLAAISDAAAAAYGIAWLPCWLVRPHIRSGALVPLLKDFPSVAFDAHAVWPQTPHLPLRVRIAIDALAAQLPKATEP
jgi:DNA-binding transcriptional LysR family regulator